MERFEVILGDITEQRLDAIVNAANERLLGGGGVDGAIHRAAGPELLEACRSLPEVTAGVRCPTGEARITPSFRIPARYVIHTVGPVWSGGGSRERELLSSCYRSCLALAKDHDVRSVAFPAISCGAYGFPIHDAAGIAAREIAQFLRADSRMERVVLVAFDEKLRTVLAAAVADLTL
jgi:O-acetyl-ADP-ribose deacetylase (regulator of RNase III)